MTSPRAPPIASIFARSRSQAPKDWVRSPARRGRTKPPTTSSGAVAAAEEPATATAMARTTSPGRPRRASRTPASVRAAPVPSHAPRTATVTARSARERASCHRWYRRASRSVPPTRASVYPASRRSQGPRIGSGTMTSVRDGDGFIRPNAPMLALLALGHLVVDTNQGALPALLPFLKVKFGLTYAAAGVVLLVGNVTSSVVQPVFGYLADRTACRWLLPWGLVVASVGLGLAGLA